VKRAAFHNLISSIPKEHLYYIDECGIDVHIYREYGYTPKGERLMGNVSGKKFKRTNIVAAKCGDFIVAPMIYDGTTDSLLFECWFEGMLLKSVPKNSILIMDNASFHRKKRLHELAKQVGCEVLFLPPYSPDLNPIEKYWAWLKGRLRKMLYHYDDFMECLVDCFQVR
jgi:transposase